ncbi:MULTISPECIES: phage tail protein [Photorhabdus]|uniref:phage tail protein n=1 Tax=Photorhabdus TaxID=29487 RepID=UPI000DCD7FEE|nr:MULTISPECIES: phage tail protein [Photorhabdus]AXG44990.1 phage tail protein [Photorhabdus laumondii subsp. laumondii]NDL17704.1 phage tail protein [Photorhabdus laumondii subsp. laumondii]NDL49453.1 phage tail protein [Photorhabdus laumondii subsp. laumondii]NDL54047.1 phage tail protein [Photorhabdus laumondii subsp. laumondii]RAW82587.1 phage tail protein [Photorhabdus sp. S5P8-50]
MRTKYFALLTQLGADKLANAAALGTKIEITHMAVGDGGGSLPTPDTAQTKLVNERRRAAINELNVDPKNTNQIIAEQVIPENEGGWWIREIGLFDKDGILIAVGNCAETYKPQLQEGAGRTQTIRMVLIVSSTDTVTLKVDPSVVLATREYVDESIQTHVKNPNHPDATLKDKGVVVLSSAVDSSSEIHAATPKAVKAAYDLANVADNNANGRVPASRKVNGKALSSDISLNAGDIGAYTKGEIDSRVNEISILANTVNQNATDANDNANSRLSRKENGADIPDKNAFVKNLNLLETVVLAKGAVPSNRKINGKALTGDLSLSAEDVGAYTRAKNDNTFLRISSDKSATVGSLLIDSKTPFPELRFKSKDGYVVGINGSEGKLLHIYSNDPSNRRRYNILIPERSGTLALQNAAIKSENGWWQCGDTGIIIQWVKVTSSQQSWVKVNYPISFKNKFFGYIASMSSINTSTGHTLVRNATLSTFEYQAGTPNNNENPDRVVHILFWGV